MINTEGREILQKTVFSEEPQELSGKNLRDRKALQLVDMYDKRQEATLRLTSLFMDYRTTHIGFSIDPPFDNWDITDVTILDNTGKTYWVSITRSDKEDPFFQIRVITDAIPSDAEELLISVRRLYLRDVTLEEKIINQLAAEETELLNLVSSFGADGTISEQIGEIRKRLRDLERRKFFKLPIIREELTGPWSFAFKIDHNSRRNNNRSYNLEGNLNTGVAEISPICLKSGIIRNRLICSYNNERLLKEILTEGKAAENDESLIFLEGELSPIPPALSIVDEANGKEFFPVGEHQDVLNRGSGNVILSGDGLKLNYQFEPFIVDDSLSIRIYGMEGTLPEPIVIPFESGLEQTVDIPVELGRGDVISIPVRIVCRTIPGIDIRNRITCQVRYSFELHNLLEEFWISRAILAEDNHRTYNVGEVFKTVENQKTTLQTIFHIPLEFSENKLNLKIRNYFFRMKEPVQIRQNLSKSCDIGPDAIDSSDKIIMPGAVNPVQS